MKTLIFFREGLSGNYLKSLVTDCTDKIKFRVDRWNPSLSEPPATFDSNNCICIHKHPSNYKKIITPNDLILTIQVRDKIYHATYNNFYKKFLVENPGLTDKFKNWQCDLVTWYDITFYNIKEYYHLYKQDLANNTISNVIEFDRMLELDYIEGIFKHYYNRPVSKNMERIVTTYKELQLQYDISGNQHTMNDIVTALPDTAFLESPWFASYCIFKYETNNNLLESQRLWSINSINKPIDKQFLLDIETRYQL